MKALSKAAWVTVLILTVFARPAWSQITSYVDHSGNLVYTNADAPVKVQKDKAQTINGSQQPTGSQPVAPAALEQLVQKTAERNDVDPALVRAVITTESNWNTRAISPKGAQGLMQLIPGTAEQMGIWNAFDPAQNIDAGVRYLRMLIERYNGDLTKALAAYNAGPGAVDRWRGIPGYRETREYVQKVKSAYLNAGNGHSSPLRSTVPIYRTTDSDGRVVFTNE